MSIFGNSTAFYLIIYAFIKCSSFVWLFQYFDKSFQLIRLWFETIEVRQRFCEQFFKRKVVFKDIYWLAKHQNILYLSFRFCTKRFKKFSISREIISFKSIYLLSTLYILWIQWMFSPEVYFQEHKIFIQRNYIFI